MHGMQSADGERMCVGWYAQCIIVLKEREKEKERVRVWGADPVSYVHIRVRTLMHRLC